MASPLRAERFSGGCSCLAALLAEKGCACGWDAFSRRMSALADQTDPVAFVRETATLAADLDKLLASRRPAAMRVIVANTGGASAAAEVIPMSRQHVYRLMDRTGRKPKKPAAK